MSEKQSQTEQNIPNPKENKSEKTSQESKTINSEPIERPSLEKAKKSSWWQKLFGENQPKNQTVGNSSDSAEHLRESLREATDHKEAQRDFSRSVESELLKEPKDVYELVNIIDKLDGAKFRERKIREKYGEGTIGKIKAFLAGEREYKYNRRGEIEHIWYREFARRAANILTDRRIIVGGLSMAVVGLLTGGVGAVALGGMWGAVGGKAIGEALEAAYGKERKLRAQIAKKHYENYQDLRKITAEIKKVKTDEERVNLINQLVNKYYEDDMDIIKNETDLANDKTKWDKIKGILTIAGSAIGVGTVISKEWAKVANVGIERVKMYDFDLKNGAHSIQKINKEWFYHIRDAQGHITGKHVLGGIPSQEMLKNFTIQKFVVDEAARKLAMQSVATELGKGAAMTFGSVIGHFLGIPGYEKQEHAYTKEEKEHAQKRILKEVPKEIPTEAKSPEKKETEIKVGQIWTFDFIKNKGYFADGDNIYQIMKNNSYQLINNESPGKDKIELPFGVYKVESINGDIVKMVLMDPENPNKPNKFPGKNQKFYEITVRKDILSSEGILDTRDLKDRNYQIFYSQLAEGYKKSIPEIGEIWQFDKSSYDSLLANDNLINKKIFIPAATNRYRIREIKDNFITLEPMDRNQNIKLEGVNNLKIHIADLLKLAQQARSESEKADEKEILKTLNIDPENLKKHSFISPDKDIYDIYGKLIPKNILFEISRVDENKGFITLDATENIINEKGKEEKPRIIIKIKDINAWSEQVPEREKTEKKDENKKSKKEKLENKDVESKKTTEKKSFKDKIKELYKNVPDYADINYKFLIGNNLWQFERYGNELLNEKDDAKLYRGYLMIEIKDIPKAIEMLHMIGKEYKNKNKTLAFKFLLARIRAIPTSEEQFENSIGNYIDFKDTDPRIALYADSPEDIINLFKIITQDEKYKSIIKDMSEKRTGKPRRPGTNAYIDNEGYEWRALNYNNKPGYSEDEAADPNWRDKKIGSGTIYLG